MKQSEANNELQRVVKQQKTCNRKKFCTFFDYYIPWHCSLYTLTTNIKSVSRLCNYWHAMKKNYKQNHHKRKTCESHFIYQAKGNCFSMEEGNTGINLLIQNYRWTKCDILYLVSTRPATARYPIIVAGPWSPMALVSSLI